MSKACRGVTAAFRPWTPVEDARLRSAYRHGRSRQIAEALGRSAFSVQHRAKRIGVCSHRWTADEDRKLRNLWGVLSLQALAAKLGRTQAAVYHRAQHALRLPLGCPEGYVYLTEAARRAGYMVAQLRRILRWAGVAPKQSMSRPGRSRSGRHYQVVDPFDVTEAVAAWLKTETLEDGARRRGWVAETLAARLVLLPGCPPRPRKGKHWRIPSELLDQATTVALPRVVRGRAARGRFNGRNQGGRKAA